MPSTGTLVFNDQKLQAPEMYATESLGVGVSVPTSNLEVTGNAYVSSNLDVGGSLGLTKGSSLFVGDSVVMETSKHDRPLVKYPEIAMTANSSGGYVASASSQYAGGDYDIWKAHDGERTNAGSPSYYYSSSHEIYSTTNGAYAPGSNPSYSTTSSGTAYAGEYVQMQFPTPIKLSYVRIVSASTSTYNKNAPKQGVICGSNDGTTWTTIAVYSGITYPTLGASADIQASTDVAYTYIRLVVTHTEGVGSSGWLTMEEIEYYATEEGDVSTDVTLSSAYNKPGTEQLEVYWDGADPNSYPGAGTEVFDLSGNGVKGTLTNNTTFDSTYDAWKWNATGPSGITGSLAVSGGDWAHSFSYWMKVHSLPSSGVDYLFGFASAAAYSSIAHYINTSGQLVVGSWTLDYPVENFTIPVGEWFHVLVAYQGGGFSPNVNAKTYINGKLMKMGANISSGTDGTALTVPTTAQVIYFGYGYGGTATQPDATAGPFRMYSGKALNAEQVKELYAYDAVRFGHRASNSVSLHKGNLGVGVTAPTSRFEVAGNERIQEYPPRAMTGYETYMEGHGVFKAYANSEQNGAAWKAFNKTDATGEGWVTDQHEFVLDTGYSNTLTSTTNTVFGRCSFLALETPGLIKLEKIRIQPDVSTSGSPDSHDLGMPKDFQIWARKSGTDWTRIAGYYDQTFLYLTGSTEYYDVNATDYYSEFAIVVTRTHTSTSYSWTSGTSQYSRGSIGEWRLFGTPAPSTLDDGHLTLGKTLTTPRVSGHAAGAETPRAESLVVHYDTTVDSVKSGNTVVDTSGAGSNGTLTNGAAYSSSDRALTFDGTNDHMVGTINNPSGAWVHTVSVWFKNNTALNADFQYLHFIGSESTNKASAIQFATSSSTSIYVTFYGNYLYNSYNNVNLETVNEWRNITYSYEGGNTSTTNPKIYVDGKLTTGWTLAGGSSGTAPNLDANASIKLAGRPSNTQYFNGSISNFKIWGGVALTAAEVEAEYALGRTGKALNVTDTAVCLGGTVPRAQLDVRGTGMFDGGLVIKADNLEYARDGGITLSRAGLGTAGNEYSSQPIVLDGGDAGAVDANIRGGAIWSQWGGAQYGIAMKGASHSDTYPYLQTPTMFVTNDKVGIGTSNPGEKLTVQYSSTNLNELNTLGFRNRRDGGGAVRNFYLESSSGKLRLRSTGTYSYYAYLSGNGSWSSFTGAHHSKSETNEPIESGMIVSSVGKYIGEKRVDNSLPYIRKSTTSYDKSCYGVLKSIDPVEEDEENFYKGEKQYIINSLGEGAIWVTNINGSLESGDYITTSNVAGYGMRQDSEFLANYTVAKITMDCDFEPATQPVQQIVKELSNVNYWVETTYTDVALEEYSNLAEENRRTVTDSETVTYQKIDRVESTDEQEGYTLEVREELVNVLDEHGQLQWEDHPTETEKAYKIRYLTADGTQTDEANAVHIAAFVGCTYHCG